MTKTQKIAALKKIVALAEPMRTTGDLDDAQLSTLGYLVGSIVANAEDAIEELEGELRMARVQSWEANFLGALASGNVAINGKRVR